MPKELFQINKFHKGVVSTPESGDISEDSAVYSKNIDCTSRDGALIGTPGDSDNNISFLDSSDASVTPAEIKKTSTIRSENVAFASDGKVYSTGLSGTSGTVFKEKGTLGQNYVPKTITQNNKELHIGSGNTSPKWVGYVGTDESNLVVEDAEVRGPGSETFANNYTKVIGFRNKSNGTSVHPYCYAFKAGDPCLYRIHKTNHTQEKSGNLGFDIQDIAECVSVSASDDELFLWVLKASTDIATSLGTLYRVSLGSDSTFESATTWANLSTVSSSTTEYALSYHSSLEAPAYTSTTGRGDFALSADGSVNIKQYLSVAGMVETGQNHDGVIWLQVAHTDWSGWDESGMRPMYRTFKTGENSDYADPLHSFLFATKTVLSDGEPRNTAMNDFRNHSFPARYITLETDHIDSSTNPSSLSIVSAASLSVALKGYRNTSTGQHSYKWSESDGDRGDANDQSYYDSSYSGSDPSITIDNSDCGSGWLYHNRNIDTDTIIEGPYNVRWRVYPYTLSASNKYSSSGSASHFVTCLIRFNDDAKMLTGGTVNFSSGVPQFAATTQNMSGLQLYTVDYTENDDMDSSNAVNSTESLRTSLGSYSGSTGNPFFGNVKFIEQIELLPHGAAVNPANERPYTAFRAIDGGTPFTRIALLPGQFQRASGGSDSNPTAVILYGNETDKSSIQIRNLEYWNEYIGSNGHGFANLLTGGQAEIDIGSGSSDLTTDSPTVESPIIAELDSRVFFSNSQSMLLADTTGDLRTAHINASISIALGGFPLLSLGTTLTNLRLGDSGLDLQIFDTGQSNDYFFKSSTNVSDSETKFWKVSYEFDGYQESPISSSHWDSSTMSWGAVTYAKSMKINLTLKKSIADTMKRLTSINVYRADSVDLPYRLVKRLDFKKKFVLGSDDIYRSSVVDYGRAGASYEAITGIPESLDKTIVNYGISTIAQNHLVIADCYDPIASDDFSKYIFKSKHGKFDTFNWIENVLSLPKEITALSYFKGKIYAFAINEMYRIDSNGFYLEDTYEGIGCLNNNCVVSTDYGLYWCDKSNIYHFNGSAISPIGSPIIKAGGVFNKTWSIYWQAMIQTYQDSIENSSNGKHNYKMIYSPKRNSISVLGKTLTGTDYKGMALTYHILKKRWDFLQYPIYENTVNAVNLYNDTYIDEENDINFMYYDPSSGNKSKKWLSSSTNNAWEWVSKKITLGAATLEKYFYKVKMTYSGTEPVVTAALSDNSNPAISLSNNDASSGLFSHKLEASNKKQKNIQLKIIGDVDTEVESLSIVYRRKSIK